MSANPEKPAEDAPQSGGEPFGRWLSREREMRGMTLEQVAEQTRIGTTNLRALEQDDAARLPARVFVVGYIRAYAAAIGISADEAVLRYDEQRQRDLPPEDEAAPRRIRKRKVAALVLALAAAGGAAWHYLLR